jgi:hypothetical protein
MTDTTKTAEKQPDQADPQKAPETPGKTDADQRRVLVCLNCGHIWEAKAGTLRPQCFECKRQRVRPATPEEIAQFDQGVTKIALIPPADSGTKAAEPDQQKAEKQPDQADQSIDQQVDPISLVDPVRISKKKSAAAPETSPLLPVMLLLVILGIIAALYFLFASSGLQEIPQEYRIEEPAPAPVRFAGAALPGM